MSLFALPEQPVGAGPVGLGGNYFVANDRSRPAAGLFAKQAFVTFRDLGGIAGPSLKIGRMEAFDGADVTPKNPASYPATNQAAFGYSELLVRS